MTALNFLRHGLIVLELTPTTPGFDLGSVDGEYFEAISYGPYEENLFDIYRPASDEPTPLLVYIHGGGFTDGSRDTTDDEAFVMSYLSEGVAFASIDYRLLTSPSTTRTTHWSWPNKLMKSG